MGSDRKQAKERERKRKESDRRVERAYRTLLTGLGLGDVYLKLPEQDRRTLHAAHFGRLSVVPGPEAESRPELVEVCRQLAKDLKRPTLIRLDSKDSPKEFRMSIDQTIGVLNVTWQMFEALRDCNAANNTSKDRIQVLACYEEALRVLLDVVESNARGIETRLAEEVDRTLCRYSDFGESVYWYHAESVMPGSGIPYCRLTVRHSVMERRRFQIDGESRTATRFGCSVEPGLRQMAWPGSILGIGEGRKLPVYFQNHALRRFDERIRLTGYEWEVRYSIWDSLERPTLVERDGDEFLVEFGLAGLRMGYFVAIPVEDAVVVRTFLFLTMQGTPESRLLRERLKLRRDDVEHLELDRLETFLNTDMQLDGYLVRVFEQCGCGHLLRLRDPSDLAQVVRGQAERMKHYLGAGGLMSALRGPAARRGVG